MSHHRSRPGVVAALASFLLALAPVLPGAISAGAATGAPGYWFVAADGGIFAFGDAGFYGSTGNIRLNQPIVGMAPTPTGKGYWFVAADGGVFSYGDAKFYGSTGNLKLNRPIVGMAATPTGKGYWFVASDGGIFSFGDAKFYGSTGNIRLAKPIVGMAATPTGKGYWFVASDGGIFSYGDAKFHGSTGSSQLRSPIVSMAATPTGRGYWFVAADGGAFSFGDAGFEGSVGGRPLAAPVVGMAPTASGKGYWFVASDGGIFSFGDAGFHGSTGGIRLNRAIVGMAPMPGSGTPSTSGGGTSPTQPPGGGGTTTTSPGSTPTTLPPNTTTTVPTPGPGISWGTPGTTTRLAGTTGGGDAFRPWMSGDGRFVAFDSSADRVIGGDTNALRDVFVYDRVVQSISRVSVATGGAQATGPKDNAQSQRPTISADGRYVAFWSSATNLVPGDTNGVPDAFVHDRATNTTTRVSVSSDGVQGDGESARPVISRDGRFVAFESAAKNLVGGTGLPLPIGGGDTNSARDIFVHELATKKTTRVSVSSSGQQADGQSGPTATISGNGRLVAFSSDATNLVSGDTNGRADIFVHNLDNGQTTRVSVAANGTQADKASASPSISADGRFVSFDSAATNLGVSDSNGTEDIYVKDLQSGAVSRVSVVSGGAEADGGESRDSSISGDGRYVAFWSGATNLVANDRNGFDDIFVHDRQTGITRRVSVSTSGTEGNGNSYSAALSVDGRFVAYDSKATNLATGGTSGQDVFVYAL
jgi:Tol biopolymer transport system component